MLGWTVIRADNHMVKDGRAVAFLERAVLAARFWTHVDRSIAAEESGCWLWTGPVSTQGYGTVSISNKRYTAHRLSLSIHGISLEPGLVVDHMCHNENQEACTSGPSCWHRLCVNPSHLEQVSIGENVKRSALDVCGYGHPWKFTKAGVKHCPACLRRQRRNKRADGTY